MNQKGFVNIILVVVIVVILIGTVGYFAFVKKSEPIIQQPTPTLVQSQPNLDNRQFIKIKEDGDNFYYEGRVSASGTYSIGIDAFYFDLNPDQEYLFPGLKATDYADGKTHLAFEPSEEAINLLNPKTKLSSEAKIGMPCEIEGKTTVVIPSYRAVKNMVPGNYNQATLEKVLSKTEESYKYWEQRKNVKENILDCTGVTP